MSHGRDDSEVHGASWEKQIVNIQFGKATTARGLREKTIDGLIYRGRWGGGGSKTISKYVCYSFEKNLEHNCFLNRSIKYENHAKI